MMFRFKFYHLLFLLLTLSLNGQTSTDSSKSRAKSIIYDQPDETIKIALKLLTQEKKVDEVAHLYMLISNAYIVKRNTDSSLFYILKATDIINTDALPTTKIKILFSVAVQYQQMELYDKALASLDQSQEMTEKLPANDKDRLFNSGFINAVRGMIYRNQSNPDLALEKFKLAAKNFHELPLDKKTSANLSIIHYNIGNCFIDLSQYRQATFYFKEAEKYAKIYRASSLEAYALKGLGESFFLTHQYDQSLKVLYQAEVLAEPSGDLVLNEGIYKLLANNNLAINDFQKFQNYNTKYLEVQKTLEQNELKSLNRYLNTQNVEQQKINVEVAKRFRIYNVIAVVCALGLIVFLMIHVIKQIKKNRRQRNLIETLTKSKELPSS
ncbi:hypothetical protein SAMN05421765_0595 [Kaistella antarctica]|uniref:Tetratricopeptide repeat n=2 Tax=Kaistella antarctica TaxID=266748 RepID=A0A3S4UZM6_9FLAO|nr:hypothetical protein SAMN05421765_0595 [Kaistella antarctica]VEI00856.1 Tetratricopeptide repeat [Kaistella antarctica]